MELCVEERGTGEHVLWLLHGLGASRDHQYAVADLLGDRYRCLLPDLRGHGDSEGGPVLALETFAEDLAPYVRERPGAVAGLSLGALVAVQLWQRLPTLPAVILIDPMLDAAPVWDWACEGTNSTRDAYRKLISPYLEKDLEALVRLMAGHPLTAGLAEDARRRNARSHLRADEETIQTALTAMRLDAAPIAWERPEGSTTSLHIVRATRSPACPEPAAQAVAGLVGATISELDSGHCASLDEPGALAACLAGLLSPA
jgi:pimeloyl-ACP methyl ester carboxylesterase